ncbi:MAG: DNA repair protein RecN [Flavobacteriaceae bacterium]
MLASLSIQNYILIDHLKIDFKGGLSIITGETGAGKSILLGALGLVLGERADLSIINNTDKKCIIEAVFAIQNYKLKAFFTANDLDYEDESILRREILPSGKSRAFLNDTPVTLNVLQSLSSYLIDVHAQQETAKLSQLEYQFQIVDVLAHTSESLAQYTQKLQRLKFKEKELAQLIEDKNQSVINQDYDNFIFDELTKANLAEDELPALESTLEKLENIDSISQSINVAVNTAEASEIGINDALNTFTSALKNIAKYDVNFSELSNRIESLKIEFDDIYQELLDYKETIDLDPAILQQKQERLNLLNTLLQKHRVATIADLVAKKDQLERKIALVNNSDAVILEVENQIKVLKERLLKLGDTIHKKRQIIVPDLQKKLENLLAKLGMPHAQFDIVITKTDNLFANGIDNLAFLFKANKGGQFGKISKVASGGERSRIMLAIKAILSQYSQLPTIIFDEIDAGISGEVANAVAAILQSMTKNMQVLAITHLPQIAAKGHQHYKVFKETQDATTKTDLKLLNNEERVIELAEMLGGKKISESAILHAKALLQ